MRYTASWIRVFGVLTPLVAGCATPDEATTNVTKIEEPLVLTEAIPVLDQGRLAFGGVAFMENPTTQLDQGVYHGYNFRGKTGAVITISMEGENCLAPDTFLHLFKPSVNGDRGEDIARNDDFGGSDCFFDSKIQSITLPADGDYLIVATSFLQRGGGHYRLTLTCDAGDAVNCAQPNQISFQSSRLLQTDIEARVFTPAQLFSNGFFLFKHIYNLNEGLGNALIGAPAGNNPPPNFRNVHQGGFGAPESQSCATCHNIAGVDGAGENNRNIFQAGDGVNPESGFQRHPPQVLGLGYRQAIAVEMSNDLKGQLAAAKAAAAAQGTPVTQALSSKGISFGSVVANPDGTTVNTGIQGVDPDLNVRGLGWKFRETFIRRFAEGGFRVHFGMQYAPSVARHCQVPNPNTFGNGPNCLDPDADGVQEEITEGQLTSLAIYLGLRQVPIRVAHQDPALQEKAVAGEALFAQVGCATCHVPSLRLNNPRAHFEPGDTTGGGITFDLTVDTRTPRPTIDDGGGMIVEMYTDMKRHDMGPGLADPRNFNQIAAREFGTTPLWGVANTPPYLHDGRAATLHDAIIAHGGESQASTDAYNALGAGDQAKIIAFLNTLSRDEFTAPAPLESVDLSGFRVVQSDSARTFVVPAGTLVPRGGVLVIGRNASAEQFQQFYGRLFGRTAVFINSGDRFPTINGGERYRLRDSLGTLIDGPTVPQPGTGRKNFTRVSGSLPAGDPASWVVGNGDRTAASPGVGLPSTGESRIFISEFSDNTTNFNFEFVEIAVH